MDLVQFRTLKHVAELGSLSKAADRLRIAQPALSRQIRLLEDELGTRLFDRHGRGMMITEAGREVLARASHIMAEVDEIHKHVAELGASVSGRVVVGLPPSVAESLSVPLVASMRTIHPHLRPYIINACTGFLLDGLQSGELDLAVLYDPQPANSLRSWPLLLESLFLIGPADAPLSLAHAIPFADLHGETLMLPGPRHSLRVLVERCAAEAGITLNVGVEADAPPTLSELVKHGHGLTIQPLAPINDDIAAGRLTAAPLIEPVPARHLVMFFPSDRPVSRAARFAADTITTLITDLVERGVWNGQLTDA